MLDRATSSNIMGTSKKPYTNHNATVKSLLYITYLYFYRRLKSKKCLDDKNIDLLFSCAAALSCKNKFGTERVKEGKIVYKINYTRNSMENMATALLPKKWFLPSIKLLENFNRWFYGGLLT
ncbi:MAG: hypothetical protein HC896_18830 [Bacteroidales bacterium]|nr:hypothetical protein [Bacteroidales bacterium]